MQREKRVALDTENACWCPTFRPHFLNISVVARIASWLAIAPLIVLGGGWLSGCAPIVTVPDEQYQQALELVDRGAVLLRGQHIAEAKAAFQTAYELAPLAAAVDGLGCTALYQGDLIGAEGLFQNAYSMDGTYDDALANRGLVLDLQGRHQEALETYRAYLALRPNAAHVRNNLAALEYERGADTIRVTSELRKAAVLSQHAVITDNLQTAESLQKEGF